jgi:aspartyl aminopeptidase
LDIGVPLLAMHSAMETMGAKDLDSIIRLMVAFFSAER